MADLDIRGKLAELGVGGADVRLGGDVDVDALLDDIARIVSVVADATADGTVTIAETFRIGAAVLHAVQRARGRARTQDRAEERQPRRRTADPLGRTDDERRRDLALSIYNATGETIDTSRFP